MFGPKAEKMVAEAAAEFPATFGLRRFAGKFRISLEASYVGAEGVMLYTQVERGGQWLDFAKGTPAELRAQVVAP